MKLAETVILALLLASSFATAMYLFVSFFAENELEKSEFVKITNNRIEIFANYENLEYYIRCSMFAYAQQKTVIDTSIFILLRIKSENLGLLTSLLITSAIEAPSISSCTCFL